ncbi:MAG: NADH-quinone oxidoreductase subunit L [Candidatus Bathyarchaeia archaeon]
MLLDDVSSWLVWVLPLVSSLFVPLFAKYSARARDYFVIAVSAVTAGLALSLVPGVFFGSGKVIDISITWISGINAGVYVDPLSVLFTALVAFFGLIILIYSLGYMKGEEGLTRYYFLMLLFVGSMIGLVISDNLIQLFIFWEMVGFCSYALVSFWYKRPESIKAGHKVFIMTRIGDASLLAAIGILYATFGTFSFHLIIGDIQSAATAGTLNTGLMVTVAFLVLGGAIAKSAQLPLFTWLYSAMEAPTSVSALLHAATMVKAGIYLLARFILIFAAAAPLMVALQPLWLPTVAWIGVLTAFVGATLAFTTTDIKGVLAYSTVSQLGFMMAALGAALNGPASVGWFASLFHMVSHAFFEGLGFLLAGGIIHALGTRDMRLMGGLRKAMPVTFVLAVIMVITTSGLPPFAAFFSKGLVITSVTDVGNLAQIVLLYITTAITFAYSLRFLSLIFMGKESEHLIKQHPHEAPNVMLYPAAILAGLCIVWGLAEPLVLTFMHVDIGVTLLGSFLSLETPIFLALLVPTGLLVYWFYYKDSQTMKSVVAGLNPVATVLKHGYFFDDFYYAVAKGTTKLAEGLGVVEDTLFSRFPQAVSSSVVAGAKSTQKSLDVLADQLLNVLNPSRKTSEAKERSSSSLQHYLAAAVLGFILIVILIILTVGV